ncbi:thioesterase family protein [Nocardioides sp.]|uniref:acyl-CoA thioesterase n=1 Tax=Nocardioides sp. TaxID=35761 RepID=UPI001A2AE37B|nr:thioesterase family protein [Nocardioides sp.]MBJ7357633.1 acyl-CoA thioesterase [Nocardioides sp.]
MRHVYECPMRWADLDMLGHVNNVTYVDYLQEARVDMLRAHGSRPHGHSGAGGQDDLAEGVVVVRHEVTYLRPLLFTFEPVMIECWVTEVRAASFTIAYEIFRESRSRPGERNVFVRATTVLTPYVFTTERPRRITPEERARLEEFLEPEEERPRPPRLEPVTPSELGRYAVHVRFSDVDVYGHVNNVKYFEYFQEARLLYLTSRLWAEVPSDVPRASIVVAQTDVDYRRPILFRPEPYDCWSRIERVGTRSLTLVSEIHDGETVLARARVTIVFVDPESGRSTEPPEAYRAPLLAAQAAAR